MPSKLICVHQPLMSWVVSRKIKLEQLKETRPEKELSSDSEESSAGDGMIYFVPPDVNIF